MLSDRSDLYNKLRKELPTFVYESFSYTLNDSELQIVYSFSLGNKYIFHPAIRVPLPENTGQDIITNSLIRNIIFNMGMVELISYWKAACPPTVIIRPMVLTESQIKWWKKLYRNGLGEFFHENGISPGDHFMEIRSEGSEEIRAEAFRGIEEVLVPVGGGKDSVVSLELLSKIHDCRPFIINPREASRQSALNAGYSEDQILNVYRSIDPLLLELNSEGFLNGHTPFSAMLAFTSTLVAVLNGISKIALSNESSANEPTIPGTKINHQYSKSMEFEEDFRAYMSAFVSRNIDYYSLLRPLNELQIAGIFSGFPHHFKSFRSCNVGSKTDSWCGECPKCLFTYIMLSVFLASDELIAIFGNNLFQNEKLIHIFDQLCGTADEKPFECVGTIDEVNIALQEIIRKYQGDLPILLQHYAEKVDIENSTPGELSRLLREFGPHHIQEEDEIQLLKDSIHAL